MNLPSSGFKVLRMILIGYLHEGGADRKPVQYEAVAHATGLQRTAVSGNNKGLADLGIVEFVSRGHYKLTEQGYELARGLEFDNSEVISSALSLLLMKNDEVSRAFNALKARQKMTAEDLANHIAMVAGVKKQKTSLAGARAIIEMLILAGLVEQDGQALTPSASVLAETKARDAIANNEDTGEDSEREDAVRTPAANGRSDKEKANPDGKSGQQTFDPVVIDPKVQINFEIHIDADSTADMVEEIFKNMRKYVLDRPSEAPNESD